MRNVRGRIEIFDFGKSEHNSRHWDLFRNSTGDTCEIMKSIPQEKPLRSRRSQQKSPEVLFQVFVRFLVLSLLLDLHESQRRCERRNISVS